MSGKVEKEKDRLVVSCRLLRNTNTPASGSVSASASDNGGSASTSASAGSVSGVEDVDDGGLCADGLSGAASGSTGASSAGTSAGTSASTSTTSSSGTSLGLGLAEVEVWTIFDGAHEALALRPASQLPGD